MRQNFNGGGGTSSVLTKKLKIETAHLLSFSREWFWEVKSVNMLKSVEFHFGIFLL